MTSDVRPEQPVNAFQRHLAAMGEKALISPVRAVVLVTAYVGAGFLLAASSVPFFVAADLLVRNSPQSVAAPVRGAAMLGGALAPLVGLVWAAGRDATTRTGWRTPAMMLGTIPGVVSCCGGWWVLFDYAF